MKAPIEKPKVFISYAWGSDEYQEKVMSFVESLLSDGVEVIFDKFDLTEGNDTYAFMEKCVSDPSVTNVLMLLDPIYAQKADAHTGGVGTETQIISPNVYKEVAQEKFIPIVFERDEEGNVCKPVYLQGRLHFDLSIIEKYNNEYQRLIRSLYGVKTYAKPELGSTPLWVTQPEEHKPIRQRVEYDILKREQANHAIMHRYKEFLAEINGKIVTYRHDGLESDASNEMIISIYDAMHEIRDQYLHLLTYSVYVPNSDALIGDFFEDLRNVIGERRASIDELKMVFLHELFIYTIGWLLKNKEYKFIGNLLSRTYFDNTRYANAPGPVSFNKITYSQRQARLLDDAVCTLKGQNYHSGTANHWIETINTMYCSKEEFIAGDLFCFNYSIYGANYMDTWNWFPLTYVYDNEFHSCVSIIARKLVSKQQLDGFCQAFGFDSSDGFIENFNKVVLSEPKRHDYRSYRFPSAFESALYLELFVKPDELGTLP